MRIDCHTIPSDDAAFRDFVRAAVDRLGSSPDPGELTRLVRHAYPEAIVRPQSDLAKVDHVRVWYVYRER